jgi:hypothetical protein
VSAHPRPPSDGGEDQATNGLDITGWVERPSTDTIAIGTLTVTFDVRYVTGEQGERVAARQAEAIAALARWAAHPNGGERVVERSRRTG